MKIHTEKKCTNKLEKKGKILKNSNYGITLIALVITIIVLLILAGISISMLTGDNSILNQASQANIEQRAGTVQEEKDLWTLSKTTDEFTSTSDSESLDQLLERLGPNNQKLLTAEEVEEVKTTGQVTIGSKTIVFGKESSFEIGDVVEAEGLATFKDSEDNNIEWIYFGKDDKGNNLVTTEKPLDDESTFFAFNDLQIQNATDNEKKENSAKNWLYYDLQDTDTGYTDADCTETNNINKFCAKLYNDNGGRVGKARSITLEDINRVTGFEAPIFSKYNFGTSNNFSNPSIIGNHTVNYYYPTLDAKNQLTNISASPKVYKYWKKAREENENIVDEKNNVLCDGYYYYKDSYDNSYKLFWEGTNKNWSEEELDENSSWKLEKPENMKYVIGENSEYTYAVASHSVKVYINYAIFCVACVNYEFVDSQFGTFCNSNSDNIMGLALSYSKQTRPVVSLAPSVKLETVTV